jgi:hypothetical protein
MFRPAASIRPKCEGEQPEHGEGDVEDALDGLDRFWLSRRLRHCTKEISGDGQRVRAVGRVPVERCRAEGVEPSTNEITPTGAVVQPVTVAEKASGANSTAGFALGITLRSLPVERPG